jgi:hypothetical protein
MVKHLLLAVLPVAALALAPSTAFAQDYDEDQPPPQPAVQPVYTAPLSQTTQTTYVPQSVAMSGPEEITDFDFERPVPLGYTMVKRPRKGMIIGGAVSFGVSYGISVLSAAIGEDISSDGRNEAASMWIPVAGPFLQMAQTDSATLRVFLFGLGAAQTTGAILLYYGLTTKKRVLVRNDIVGSLMVTPTAGDGTAGMLLSGRF